VARRRRDTSAGVFHVTGHSVWTADLFRDDLDRLAMLGELASAVAAASWTCLVFCLMTTHYHLILDVDSGTLPAGMRQLNTRYACRFNARHRLRGHVFGSRYGSSRLETDAHLLAAFAYVARNPVEANLCSSPLDWHWSSYAGTVGLGEPQTFVDGGRLIRMFGGTREVAIARLRAFVEDS
jgi:REP-associated tyrosine transposase